jgi:hypothetical protein
MTVEFGTEALRAQLGRLAKMQREEMGIGRVRLANQAGIGSDKTIFDFEFGRRQTAGTNQRKLEKALGWRQGAIDDVMRMVDRKASTITMEDLLAPKDLNGLAAATNEELLEELRRRMA